MVLVVSPDKILKFYNYTLELDQPVILNCSVSAVPRPEFQWILADTEEPLPESSWNSTTYINTTATSTLNYTFERADINENCSIHIVCIATNPYAESEHHFTLNKNCKPGPNKTSSAVIIAIVIAAVIAAVIAVVIALVALVIIFLVIYKRVNTK